MPKPQGDTRPLQYPLNRNADVISDTPNEPVTYIDLSLWDEEDSDTRKDVVMNLSLNEYVALAETIDVGRDIAFGSNSIEIWWIWVRGLVSLGICESFIDCINNDQATKDALLQFLNDNGITGDSSTRDDIGQRELVIQPACDFDNLFGLATGLTDLINNLAVDFIEILEASTNSIGRLGDAIEAIPGVGILPFDDAFQFVESYIEDFAQNYDASYTVGLRDEIRCDLFCIAKSNDCQLTLEDVFGYFMDKFVTTLLPPFDFEDLIEWLTQGLFSGVEVVYGWHVLVTGMLWIGTSVLDIDSNRFTAMINALYNDPDSDWETLCDTCNFNCAFWDTWLPLPSQWTILEGASVPNFIRSETTGFSTGLYVKYLAPANMDVRGINVYAKFSDDLDANHPNVVQAFYFDDGVQVFSEEKTVPLATSEPVKVEFTHTGS